MSPETSPERERRSDVDPRRALVRTTTVGDIRVHALDAGTQKLDGGAMFGVVPKPLWERGFPPTSGTAYPWRFGVSWSRLRTPWFSSDTGVGNKESDKFHDIYGIENAGAPTRLEDAIRAAGFLPRTWTSS